MSSVGYVICRSINPIEKLGLEFIGSPENTATSSFLAKVAQETTLQPLAQT